MKKRNKINYLDSFYNLRSDIKFTHYQLTLCDDKVNIVLKDLKTGKEYQSSIYNTPFTSAEDFIKRTTCKFDGSFFDF